MTFSEKLNALLRLSNKAAVAKAAKISAPTLFAYLAGESKPTSQNALKLAKAIGVDIGWLIDDARSWPPVRVESAEHEPSAAA